MKKVDINKFGAYKEGLSFEEIQEYLKRRAGVKQIGDLFKRFGKLSNGGKGIGVVLKEESGNHIYLMSRKDVKRFADIMFGKDNMFD